MAPCSRRFRATSPWPKSMKSKHSPKGGRPACSGSALTSETFHHLTPMLKTFCLLFAVNGFAGNPAVHASDIANQPAPAHAEKKPRARDLGIPFDGTPG